MIGLALSQKWQFQNLARPRRWSVLCVDLKWLPKSEARRWALSLQNNVNIKRRNFEKHNLIIHSFSTTAPTIFSNPLTSPPLLFLKCFFSFSHPLNLCLDVMLNSYMYKWQFGLDIVKLQFSYYLELDDNFEICWSWINVKRNNLKNIFVK